MCNASPSYFETFRCDVSMHQNYYWDNKELKRTIRDVKDCAEKKTYSCIRNHQPLLDISLENVVLDELHQMLRVTG